MKVDTCEYRPILQPCSLEGYVYQIDPYIGCEHCCYYCYALNQAETDWKQEVLIHQDITAQLNQELSELDPQPIYFGWSSDPYQPAEATHRQTRQAMELLAINGFSVCILTKSDLVVRDIDLLARMPGSSGGISIAFQDERVRGLFEHSAPSNTRRIDALKALKEAGIRTYTLITPIMPFITDIEILIDQIAPYADTIYTYALSIDSEESRNWQYIRRILNSHFPELTERYRQITFTNDHPYWAELRQQLQRIQQTKQLDMRIHL